MGMPAAVDTAAALDTAAVVDKVLAADMAGKIAAVGMAVAADKADKLVLLFLPSLRLLHTHNLSPRFASPGNATWMHSASYNTSMAIVYKDSHYTSREI